jgi:tRNA(Ile)-lysidine synthase
VSFSPQRLREALDDILREAAVAPAGFCVGLSGGLDSTVLLAALADAGVPQAVPLRAVHVDHGLHADASLWSAHSSAVADRAGVACEIVRVDARPRPGESPEAAARAARYAAFAARLLDGEALLTAHHGDDQLETVLLQCLRGGGLRAVAGMWPIAKFARGWHVRPLLGFGRADLRAWADGRRLEWLEDPSNADQRFDRNYLRGEVLPRLLARWPAAARTIGRVAARSREALDLEAEIAGADLVRVAEGSTLLLRPLATLPGARQRLVLREWLRGLGLAPPSAATLEALRHDVLAAADSRVPETRWPGVAVRRYRDRLFASPASADIGDWRPGRLRPGAACHLGAAGRLELEATTGQGLSSARLTTDLDVVMRPSGAVFRPAGCPHHKELRKWLQERGVLPWQRRRLPCLVAGGEIVAVGDLAYGGSMAAAPGEPAWRVVWHGRPPLTATEAAAVRAVT